MHPRSCFRYWRTFLATTSIVLGLTVASAPAAHGEAGDRPPFDPSKAGFTVTVAGHVVPYDVFALFVLPGKELAIEPKAPAGATSWRVVAAGVDERIVDGRFRWTAPSVTGLYPMTITAVDGGGSMTLNVFVMVPIAEVKDGVLNGYRIGRYPEIAYKGLDIYRPPRGFIEVTEANRQTRVSPHFTLGQFLCKQTGGWPKYVVLRERLLLKLELILEKVNEAGHRCDTFFVMSGYRTPYYNHLIGNVKYSRHQWGGAADIFIDEVPPAEVMDDLNGDGRLDVRDAHELYGIIDRMFGKAWYEPFIGGLGAYRKTSNHGPFVHVDARGFRARWGD